MNAFVLTDINDSQEDLALFRQYLAEAGIHCNEFGSAADLVKYAGNFSNNEPVLFFPNIWTRYSSPAQILEYHYAHRNLNNLCLQGKIREEDENITYYPWNILNHNDTLLSHNRDLVPHFINIQKTILKPTANPLHIFITGHKRADYLNLTLNSLLHSLDGDEKVVILLNEPTEEVKRVAFKYILSDNVEFIEIEKNCFYSSLNLGLQLFKPKKFLNFEEDFILPQTVKTFYPSWSRQFSARLDKFDLVGWSPNVDNAPIYHRMPRPSLKPFGSWETGHGLNGPQLLGQALGMRLDFYKHVLRNEPTHWHTALDSQLRKHCGAYCTPALKGYHIGWNQQMDGYGSLFTRDFKPPLKNFIRNSKTREIKEMNLEDILR